MPTNRVIYNNQLLMVGPAPASGYFFADTNGVPTPVPVGTYNLIQPLKRTQSFSYSIEANPLRVSEIGAPNNLYDYNLAAPLVNIDFDYLISDLRNEVRLGFYVKLSPNNLDQLDGGIPYPSGNILSGFSFGDQLYGYSGVLNSQTNNTIRYPFTYRDKRNIFLVISPYGDDVINNLNISGGISGMNVLGFGNCYINSYKINAQVGDFPKANVSYVAENVIFYSSGVSGISPYIEPKSGNVNSNIRFNIPTYNTAYEESGNALSVLQPGDILLDIFDAGTNSKSKSNIIVQDALIQSFDISLPLERESLNSLGYEFPLDRQINTPITVNTNFNAILRNLFFSGYISDNITKEQKYDLVFKLNKTGTTIIRYDIRGAKLKNYNYSSNIGSNSNISFSFYADMDLTYPSQNGLYMSGVLQNWNYTSFIANGPI